MAIYIKANCGDCTFDPCQCSWGGAEIVLPYPGWEGTQIDTYDVTGNFTFTAGISIELFDDGATEQVKVYANGVLIFDTGPAVTLPYSHVFSVPAGTTSLEIDTIRTVGGDGTEIGNLVCD